MRSFYHTTTFMGIVKDVTIDEEKNIGKFRLELRSKDVLEIFISDVTNYNVLQNLDNLNVDRVLDPDCSFDVNKLQGLFKVKKYVWPDGLISVQCIVYENGDTSYYQATNVNLLHSTQGRYLFEDTHWWLTQIQIMANQWLDELFGDKRSYILDDFVGLYRTNLNILGLPTDDPIQEMATLSRYIYGLSSAYLLTGSERYLSAAKAGVKFQRDAFRILTHDGRYCFWAFGRRKLKYGSEVIEYSLNGDDYGTVPLYEQIYALAGLTQCYRITGDLEMLEDIRRTIAMFNSFYLDSKDANSDFPGMGGYFSHIDYVTRRPDTPALGDNKLKKNWNSIGDHIPAYLINIILILDPLPQDHPDSQELIKFVDVCKSMLRHVSELIIKHFPDPNPNIPFVRERFDAEWNPDTSWKWQLNRAIVGHNLKIAWNLTRVANYYELTGDRQFANHLMQHADVLGQKMSEIGIDQIRSGCFDAVERTQNNNMPVEFTWGNTKDFWQQEQGILAYLILHGNTRDAIWKAEYLKLAREMTAFWNLFFLDHDNHGIFFRVTDDGTPVVQGNYANKGGHAIAGYHSFELNFLAHTYIRSYVETPAVSDKNFVLYFKPDKGCKSINVLPDFFPPSLLQIESIKVNGMKRRSVDPDYFQIDIDSSESGSQIAVEFSLKKTNNYESAVIR